jgi:hypothetical protein
LVGDDSDEDLDDRDGIHSSRAAIEASRDIVVGTADQNKLPIEQLSNDWIDWLVQEEYLAEDWASRPHIHLDFAGTYKHEENGRNLFKLKTFQPRDFNFGGKLKKNNTIASDTAVKVMPVYKLISLNLDHNELKDDVFDVKEKETKSLSGWLFNNLRILKLNSNALSFPQILLPQLKELYLSRNNIVWFPLLAGMKDLEVLILSHNKMKTLREENFDDEGLPKLKTLDLSSNQLDISVSQLNGVLKKFESKFELTVLQWKDNPFCNFFQRISDVDHVLFARSRAIGRS